MINPTGRNSESVDFDHDELAEELCPFCGARTERISQNGKFLYGIGFH